MAKKTEASKDLCAMSNNKNDETEASKDLCTTSNNKTYQFKHYEAPGSRKHQNEQRIKLQKEMKRFKNKFKVKKRKSRVKNKHLKEAPKQQVDSFPQSSNVEATSSISLETSTSKTDSPYAEQVPDPVLENASELLPTMPTMLQTCVLENVPSDQVDEIINFVSVEQIYEDSHLLLPGDYYNDVMSSQLIYHLQLLDYHYNNLMYILEQGYEDGRLPKDNE
ncbi:28485_t:CDS:2 [Dentiscutata erythropus]|uniref:28485_t:CDS:1 n=1 Tax=Dentiscutata erythropus TaxID=1348616 RepID=A0A9N9EWI0_9GLOM|nr:28485_t:CDS:2 [Dentiscutata erythropus]